MTYNEIFLRRKNKVLIPNEKEIIYHIKSTSVDTYIATAIKNIESLGYTLSSDLVNMLRSKSISVIENFYNEIVGIIKDLKGVKDYNPMYPNFPNQVMNLSDAELYLNAIIHYATDGKWLPEYDKVQRSRLFENHKIIVIDLGTKDEFNKIFTNLMSSKTSISNTDKLDLAWFFRTNKEYTKYIPSEIPHKENAALVSKLIIDSDPLYTNKTFIKYLKTATDVLRFITAASDGDISLATNTKYRSFKRRERRLIMSILSSISRNGKNKNFEEDMYHYKSRWIRIGERIHPAEFKNYKYINNVFKKLRESEKIKTTSGELSKYIKNNEIYAALSILRTRPGELARKLDDLYRDNPKESKDILNTFESVSDKISTPVLLQVREHFIHRNDVRKDANRIFFPKGNVAKAYITDNNSGFINQKVCDDTVRACGRALIKSYKARESLGKVYIDESLKNYIVPFSQRSASNSLRSIVRGSRIPLDPNTKTVRSFIYWKNLNKSSINDYGQYNHRVDLDLSAMFLNEKWDYLEHVSYTNLRSSNYNACHSGDITDAPRGASEFIDVDINSALKYGARYLIISVNSFSGQHYNEIPECFVGWMSRENPNSGEIYDPRTVENKSDLNSDTAIMIPIIIDLKEKVVIYSDIALRRNLRQCNNIEHNQAGIGYVCKAITEMNKPNLYDLILHNAIARGNIVSDKSDADIIFSANDEKVTKQIIVEVSDESDNGHKAKFTHTEYKDVIIPTITPFDTDEIISNYL